MARKKQKNRYFVKFAEGFETQVAAYLWHYYVERRYLTPLVDKPRLAVPRPGVVRWIPLPTEEPSMPDVLRLRDKFAGRDIPLPTFSRLWESAWIFDGRAITLTQREAEAAEDYRITRANRNEIVVGCDLGRFVFAEMS